MVSEVTKKLLLCFSVPSAKQALLLPGLSLWAGSFAGSTAETLSLVDAFEHHHITAAVCEEVVYFLACAYTKPALKQRSARQEVGHSIEQVSTDSGLAVGLLSSLGLKENRCPRTCSGSRHTSLYASCPRWWSRIKAKKDRTVTETAGSRSVMVSLFLAALPLACASAAPSLVDLVLL